MSIGQNGLYPGVLAELPIFLSTLSKQAPHDTVAIIEFSETAREIYNGPPNVHAVNGLPRDATGTGSDIGAAFQQAISTLTSAAADGIQVGGVLLLSDGLVWAPSDPAFGSYGAPGWNLLHAEINSLPIKVTGYGLQLSTNKTLTNDLSAALGAVFGTHVMIAGSGTDLASGFLVLKQELLDSEIAATAAQDSGKGVQVSWSGLPGTDGRAPLNLTSAGQMNVKVTLTATTRRVPLYLTGLSAGSSGLPGAVSGTLPASDQMLAPGQSVTLLVHLTWRPGASGLSQTGGPRTVQGRLVLAGRVYSTYTQAIRHSFGDTSFSTGGLTGASSAQFAAIIPAFSNFLFIFIILVLILLLLSVISFYLLRIRLSGTFALTSVEDLSGVIPLSRWRWQRSVGTGEVIGIPGRMTVRGRLFGKGMIIRLQLENRPAYEIELAPGGRTMIAGILIVHDRNSARPHTGSG
jgi:hypothetical protein